MDGPGRSGTASSTTHAAADGGLTEAVLASFQEAGSVRLRQVMQSLVRHLHDFAREVRLTEREWQQAIAFLARAGHITTERRQEFILLSDVLGLSMLTIELNHPPDAHVTPSTVLGPFFVEDSPRIRLGGDVSGGAAGRPCWVSGQVRGVRGEPIAGARIEVWETDADGLYDVQRDDGRTACRGHLFSGPQGDYGFWGVLPVPYPIPTDGPVGDLLAASGRPAMRPAHLHFMVSANGYETLVTHIFVEGSPHLDNDPVFGVRPELIVTFREEKAGSGPGGRTLSEPWFRATFDLVLQRSDHRSG